MDRYDDKILYCRMLGNDVPFSYCRSMKESLPCSKIMDCWFTSIDIENFIMENYSDMEREVIFRPSADKVSSIISLIEKVKKL